MGRAKQYNRDEVLNRALFTFWEKGYENTSMRDLAASTGINAFSLYAEFKDKQSLFTEALNRYQTNNYRFAEEILSGDGSGFEKISRLFSGLLQQVLSDKKCKGCLTVNTTVLAKSLDNRIVTALQKNDKIFIRLFRRVVEEGQADDSITRRVEVDELAALLYTTHHGIRVVQHTQQDGIVSREAIESLLSLLKS